MLDRYARRLYAPALQRAVEPLAGAGVGAGTVTAVALAVGIGGCVAVAVGAWTPALVLWLVNRGLDGLDGALARRRAPSDLGGLLDLLADFVVYGAFVVALAVAEPGARLGCGALLASYLLNVVALLGFGALMRERDLGPGDERSLPFTTGFVEGAETIVAYAAICLLPHHAALIAWVFTGAVLVTVAQRLAVAVSVLR